MHELSGLGQEEHILEEANCGLEILPLCIGNIQKINQADEMQKPRAAI